MPPYHSDEYYSGAVPDNDPLYVHDGPDYGSRKYYHLHYGDYDGPNHYDEQVQLNDNLKRCRGLLRDLRDAVADYRSACGDWTGSAASSARADEAQRRLFELVADDG